MTRRVRVLVVDDSVVVRKVVSEWVSSDPRLEVLATASNGRLALDRIDQQKPDIVLLDVEMPEMDGLEALRQIRLTRPHLPVLMFSALTERGAMLTLDALSAGASDYVRKPAGVGAHAAPVEDVKRELLAKIHALCDAHKLGSVHAVPTPYEAPRHAVSRASSVPKAVEVVVIGASTGGPNAVIEVLSPLPSHFRVPVLLVQHMPPVFTRIFAERLDAQLQLSVGEAVMGRPVVPASMWVAPGDFHMSVTRDGSIVRVVTSQGPAENSCRPSVDVLFRSAAACYGGGVLGVVLTGMGQDGLRGCEAIKEAGGQVIVQDEATSVVWSMPGSVANARLSDAVLPLQEIGPEILRRIGRTTTAFDPATPSNGSSR